MKRLHLFILLVTLVALTLAGCTRTRSELPSQAPGENQPASDESVLDDTASVLVNPPGESFVPGEVLVKFTEDIVPELPKERKEGIQSLTVGSKVLDDLFADTGVTGLRPLLSPIAQVTGESFEALSAKMDGAQQFYVASFSADKDISGVMAALAANKHVEYAEPNYVAYADGIPQYATPNDPFFNYQWNMTALQMPAAWDVATGQGVTIAVLDTGVAFENYQAFREAPDLASTTFTAGYDFVNADSHPNDDNGHGTHVAGTLAQSTNNGEGVAGVAYNAKIMPVKVLDSLGQGTYAGIIQGINYAVANGADIINLSLSGFSGSQALQEAVDNARAQGVLVFAAAGNNGGAVEYPAKYDSVIAVGAVRYDNSRAPYSNFGAELDVVAPGGDNTVDQNGDSFGDGIVQQTFHPGEINTFRYLFMAGTSMATPHVSGIAALLLEKDPSLTPDQLEAALKSTAIDLGPAGRDDEYGAGLVQAASALAAIGGGTLPLPTATATSAPPTATPTPSSPVATPTATVPGTIATPATQPPTATPTAGAPTPTPVTGDLIKNGGFESDSDWVFVDTVVDGRYSTAQAHSGSRSALVGIIDPTQDAFSFSSAAQKITIPANATAATLKAWVYPVSTDIPSNDVQVTMILDSNFRVLKQLNTMLANDQTWQEQTFDVTAFKGQTIYVYFGAVNVAVNGKVTGMYVDDVSLVVTQ